MALLQAQNVDVLGITIFTGDSWRDEEVLHTLRTLELIGRSEDLNISKGPLLVDSQRPTEFQAFKFTSAPEPGSFGFLGLGAIALLAAFG